MSACLSCGHENRPDARFCDACGTALAAQPSAGVREERKTVTVLFADLVGFTSRAERLDPEDVRRLLQPYYSMLRTELERHGGTVEKFIGDAVMALFGAPTAHEDDPERAVRAAIAIRNALAEEDSPLQVRIAVNTGEALVALGARPSEGEGMASGDVVNTAARMQSAAPVNGILVGEATYRATNHVIDYREAESIQAKGKAEPVPVWEAVSARSRYGLDVELHPRTPLVGRDRELATLTDALERIRRDHEPQLVTLVGVPGIGKSRLVAELAQVVDRDPDLIWWRQGRSLPYGDGLSYWALAEIVKAQAGITETDPQDETARKLRAAIGAVIPDAAEADWVEQHLRALVGLGADTSQSQSDNRTETHSAWRRFVEALAEQRPLVLVFEDLHWADDGLLDFVDHVADWASAVPLLIVCMARPELLDRRPGWGGGKRNAVTASIGALSRDDTARLLADLLEQTLLPAEIQSAVLERAEGNPLYAEEYVRMLRDRGLLLREDGRWRLSSTEDLPLPETVQGMIAARLDALTPEEKELVQDAAVVGKVFWPGALAGMSSRQPFAVEEALHALERKEFVRRERSSVVAGERQYAFLHVLVRDVAYAQIPRAPRVDKHCRTAEWIATLASDRSEDRAEMLAHHYLQALELAEAAGVDTSALREPARQALIEAGERALALGAAPAALRSSQRALELSPPGDPMVPSLLHRCAQASSLIGEGGEEFAVRARDLALEAGDLELASQAAATLSVILWPQLEHDRALAASAQAVELLADLPDSPAKARTSAVHARQVVLGGDTERGLALAIPALRTAEELGLDDVASHALNTIGLAKSQAGDESCIADLERSVELALRSKSPDLIFRAYNNLANLQWRFGRLEEGSEQIRLARVEVERFGNTGAMRWLEGEEILDADLRGDWVESRAKAEVYLERSESDPYYLDTSMLFLRTKLRLAHGDLPGALDDSKRSLELARVLKDPQVLEPALMSRAWALLEAGRRDEANELFDELLAGELFLSDPYLRDLGRVLLSAGRGADYVEAAKTHVPSVWINAGVATAEGRFEDAARMYAEIGAVADEAAVRLTAAEAAAAEGRRDEAARQLGLALAYFRRVGATEYVRRGEQLLATSA